jgi:peptidoglycan/xylan/chitin deacetylase (PgdA/CDA1 family)
MTTNDARRKAAILIYHRVGECMMDPHGLVVPPQEFESQMAALKENFHPISLHDLCRTLQDGSTPERSVAVTFDDGYVDNSTHASPILQHFGIPATFFLTTERLEADEYVYWWDELAASLLGGYSPKPLVPGFSTGQPYWPMTDAAQREQAHSAVYTALMTMSCDERSHALERMFQSMDRPAHAAMPRRMTTTELRGLASRPGHHIGAHTVRHVKLTLEAPEIKVDEISLCKSQLESLVHVPVTAFSYPFGAVDEPTAALVRGAGFEAALACGDSAVTTEDSWSLPRLDPLRRGAVSFDRWLDSHLHLRN